MHINYHWLKVWTVNDAYPWPHQADWLTALGDNAIISAKGLSSRFYNIIMSEEDKKFATFTTPMGLYEFNHLPQRLCPASLMTNIFGDQNFSHQLQT